MNDITVYKWVYYVDLCSAYTFNIMTTIVFCVCVYVFLLIGIKCMCVFYVYIYLLVRRLVSFNQIK